MPTMTKKRITSLTQAYRELPSVHTIMDLDKIAGKHGRLGKCTISNDEHGKRLYVPFTHLEDIAAFVREATDTHDWVHLHSDVAEHSIFPSQPGAAHARWRTWCAYLNAPGFDKVIAYLTPTAAQEHRMNLAETRLAAKQAKQAGTPCQDDGNYRELWLTGEQIRAVTGNAKKFTGLFNHPGRTWRVYHDGWHRLHPDAKPEDCPWATN